MFHRRWPIWAVQLVTGLAGAALALMLGLSWPTIFAQAPAAEPRRPALSQSFGTAELFFPPYPSEQARMGVNRTSGHEMSGLQAGWYNDWQARSNPPHPAGAAYARIVYFDVNVSGSCTAASNVNQVSARLSDTALLNVVTAHPGGAWIIGNEPDSFYNGAPMLPNVYAELYHRYYQLIKTADPTAKISPAPIVQPSPWRMAYLDAVRNHYQATYGASLPSDFWAIHLYHLNESPCGSNWGAGPPPGLSGSGWSIPFQPSALLDVSAMEISLRDFRHWLHQRGYGQQPLLISEYGVLPSPSFNGFSNAVAAQFLVDSFTMFRTATDPVVGLAADGGRLVQMWAWFSTRHEPPPGWAKYGGDLFNADGSLTLVGQAFVSQTHSFSQAQLDLRLTPLSLPDPLSQTWTAQIYADNLGLQPASAVTATLSLLDGPTGQIRHSETISLGQIPARFEHLPHLISRTWPITPPLAYTLSLSLSASNIASDSNPANHHLTHALRRYPDLSLGSLPPLAETWLYEGQVLTHVIATQVQNRGTWTSPVVSLASEGSALSHLSGPDVIPALPPGGTHPLTFTWQISASAQHTLTLSLNPADDGALEWPFDNNRRQLTQTVRPLTDLLITKSGPTQSLAHQPMTYTLTARNGLSQTLAQVIITDSLPAGASYLRGGQLLAGGSVVSWTVPLLPGEGGQSEVWFAVTVMASDTLTNSDYRLSHASGLSATGTVAVITQIEPRCQPPLTATLQMDIAPPPPLALGQSAGLTASLTASPPVSYTWTISGQVMAVTGPSLTFTAPSAGVWPVQLTAQNACGSASVSRPLTVTLPTTQPTPTPTPGPTATPAPSGPTPTPTPPPSLAPSLKLAEPQIVNVGQIVSYTLRLRTESGTAPAVFLRDVLPPGLGFITGSQQASGGQLWLEPESSTLRWQGAVSDQTPVTVQYSAQVFTATLGARLTNTAVLTQVGRPALTRTAAVWYNPGYGFSINQGAEFTRLPTVTLHYAWNTADAVTAVQFSHHSEFSPAQSSPWLTVSPGQPIFSPWRLADTGDYLTPRWVYARFQLESGDRVGPLLDSIFFDPVLPQMVSVGTESLNGQGTGNLPGAPLRLSLTARDAESGLAWLAVSDGPDFMSGTSVFTFAGWPQQATAVFTRPLAEGAPLFIRLRDRAGNENTLRWLRSAVYLPLILKSG